MLILFYLLLMVGRWGVIEVVYIYNCFSYLVFFFFCFNSKSIKIIKKVIGILFDNLLLLVFFF